MKTSMFIIRKYICLAAVAIMMISCDDYDDNGQTETSSGANCAAIQYNYNNVKKNRDDSQRLYNQYAGTIYASTYANQVSNYNELMATYQRMARENGCKLEL